jgi:hypothetical protein
MTKNIVFLQFHQRSEETNDGALSSKSEPSPDKRKKKFLDFFSKKNDGRLTML